ncbi:MAG: dockerin type I domain-containing protein, partial [Planctomycetota bacterium]
QIDAYVANECGTSWSAPHVAGVAALLFSLDPSMTPAKARCILRGTADDLGSPIYYGEGRVNAYRALLEANGQPSLPGDLNGDGTVNDADVQMLTAYLGQFGSPSQPECLMDVNADNSIDSRDESTLKSHVMSGSPDLLVRPGCDRVGPPLCQ